MAAADVLVLPSYREGFGSVIIEAAACEVPAIAYRIDGVVDAVEDGKTGVLVPVGDVWELKRAITTLAESPDIVRNMGASARQRVSEYFASETLSSYLLEFYKKHTKSRDKHNSNNGFL